MRFLKDIPHPDLKISVFTWNEKFIIQFEAGPYQQTYKFSAIDFSEDQLNSLSPEFIEEVKQIFKSMHKNSTSHF